MTVITRARIELGSIEIGKKRVTRWDARSNYICGKAGKVSARRRWRHEQCIHDVSKVPGATLIVKVETKPFGILGVIPCAGAEESEATKNERNSLVLK